MSTEFDLPSPDETEMIINVGGKSVTIDAIDVDDILYDAWQQKRNSGDHKGSVLRYFAADFYQRYNIKISMTAANMLIQKQKEIMEGVKKKCGHSPESSSSTESGSPTPEPSDS